MTDRITRTSPLARVPRSRKMGLHPRRLAYGERPEFKTRDDLQILPESQWQEVDLSNLIWHIYDQDGIGSCATNATCGAMMWARELSGLPRRVLSFGNLYARVSGGRDQGSTLDDNLAEIQARGVCTAEVQPVLQWRTLAQNWQQSARHYKALEVYDLGGGVDGLFTALTLCWPVVIGVMWPGGGGHAILACGSRKGGNSWEAKIANSWGRNWGENGFGWLTMGTLRTMPQFGCFAIRVATSSQGD